MSNVENTRANTMLFSTDQLFPLEVRLCNYELIVRNYCSVLEINALKINVYCHNCMQQLIFVSQNVYSISVFYLNMS
jgi:hypothetical protein